MGMHKLLDSFRKKRDTNIIWKVSQKIEKIN